MPYHREVDPNRCPCCRSTKYARSTEICSQLVLDGLVRAPKRGPLVQNVLGTTCVCGYLEIDSFMALGQHMGIPRKHCGLL